MKKIDHRVRAAAVAGLFTLLPSLTHAHTAGTTADGFLHDVAHMVFGGLHLVLIPAVVLVVAGVAFGAMRRARAGEKR